MDDAITITFDMVKTTSGDVGSTLTPQFSADPELEKVQWGTRPTLVWTLKPGPNAQGAQFDSTAGIYFEPSTAYPATWPNAQPKAVDGSKGMQYSVGDPNTTKGSVTTIYKYNVTVVYNGGRYTWDPEEENEGKAS